MSRAGRLEWEHVVPASRLAGHLSCWQNGHALCLNNNGEPFKGRACCEKRGVDDSARHRINDLHNLVPSIGEVNGDRLNHPYGIVEAEVRVYGMCDFEIGGTPKRAEPADALRGNVARISLYMNETYTLNFSPEEMTMYNEWSAADPIGAWERERDQRIEAIQGNSNRFVNP